MTTYTPNVDGTIFPKVNYYKTFGTRFTARATNGRIFGSGIFEPFVAPLEVVTAATVKVLSPFTTGCQITGTTAEFTGGVQPVVYDYLWQARPTGSAAWANITDWVTVDDVVTDVSLTTTVAGSYRIVSRATSSADIIIYSSDEDQVAEALATTFDPDINPTGDFINGKTIAGILAGWIGGVGEVTYQFGWQYKLLGDTSWRQQWFPYNGTKQSDSFTIPTDAIEVRLTCVGDDANGQIFVHSQTYAVTIPLAVAPNGGSNWIAGNVFQVGETVTAKTALYEGGKEPIQYRYRFATRPTNSDPWVAGRWFDTLNVKTEVNYVLAEPGEIGLQSEAIDSCTPPVQIDSDTGARTVVAESASTPPPSEENNGGID